MTTPDPITDEMREYGFSVTLANVSENGELRHAEHWLWAPAKDMGFSVGLSGPQSGYNWSYFRDHINSFKENDVFGWGVIDVFVFSKRGH